MFYVLWSDKQTKNNTKKRKIHIIFLLFIAFKHDLFRVDTNLEIHSHTQYNGMLPMQCYGMILMPSKHRVKQIMLLYRTKYSVFIYLTCTSMFECFKDDNGWCDHVIVDHHHQHQYHQRTTFTASNDIIKSVSNVLKKCYEKLIILQIFEQANG